MSKQTNAQAINNALIAMGFQEMSRLMVIAQSGVETGMGSYGKAASVNNFFNITAGHFWTGPTLDGPDTDGAGNPIIQKWRAYPSISEGVKDYVAFLSMPRYVHSKAALMAGDVEGFARMLRGEGYYTFPVDDFIDPKTGQKRAGYLNMLRGQVGLAKQLLGMP